MDEKEDESGQVGIRIEDGEVIDEEATQEHESGAESALPDEV